MKHYIASIWIAATGLAACGARSDLDALPSGGASGGNTSSRSDAPADIFLAHQNGAVQIFVDDARVYWVTAAENQVAPPASIRSCLKEECASTTITYFTLENSVPGNMKVTIDSESVYWEVEGYNTTPTIVESCPLAGCAPQPVTVISNIDGTSIASDGTFLYWASALETSIFQCVPGNCRATQMTLAQTQGSPDLLEVTGGYAYWVASDAAASLAIHRMATTGASAVETLATGLNQTASLFVREPYVYFTNSDSIGQVLRCAVTGCPSGPTAIASALAFPTSVVADDANAYWIDVGYVSNEADGAFVKCAVGGCGTQPTMRASSQSFWNVQGHGVAIDDQYVYWVAQGAAGDQFGQFGFPDAAIHRLAK